MARDIDYAAIKWRFAQFVQSDVIFTATDRLAEAPDGDLYAHCTPNTHTEREWARQVLVELATLDGHLNGPDGVGIRWEDDDDDGTIDEIVVGGPVLNTQSLEIWPTREFEAYRWDLHDWSLSK